MWRLRKILRKIKAWMFIHRIGPYSRKYHELVNPVDRMAFAMGNFGKDGLSAIHKHHMLLRIETTDAYNRD